MIDYRKVLIGALFGLYGAFRLDWHSFAKARETDPSAPFDLSKAAPRWIEGTLGGAMVALGWQAS